MFGGFFFRSCTVRQLPAAVFVDDASIFLFFFLVEVYQTHRRIFAVACFSMANKAKHKQVPNAYTLLLFYRCHSISKCKCARSMLPNNCLVKCCSKRQLFSRYLATECEMYVLDWVGNIITQWIGWRFYYLFFLFFIPFHTNISRIWMGLGWMYVRVTWHDIIVFISFCQDRHVFAIHWRLN